MTHSDDGITTTMKMTAKERKARNLVLDVASILVRQGDERTYRDLTMGSQRYVAECTGTGDAPHGMFRRSRKFSNPLFMVPTGYLSAFPELDEHLFITTESAFEAIEKFGKPEHSDFWLVRPVTLAKQLKDKQYLRWLKEVKEVDGGYTEPRRSLEERAEIYEARGVDGLKALYSKAHALKTEHRLLAEGMVQAKSKPQGSQGK